MRDGKLQHAHAHGRDSHGDMDGPDGGEWGRRREAARRARGRQQVVVWQDTAVGPHQVLVVWRLGRVIGQRRRLCLRLAWLNPGGLGSVYIDFIDVHNDCRLSVQIAPIAIPRQDLDDWHGSIRVASARRLVCLSREAIQISPPKTRR